MDSPGRCVEILSQGEQCEDDCRQYRLVKQHEYPVRPRRGYRLQLVRLGQQRGNYAPPQGECSNGFRSEYSSLYAESTCFGKSTLHQVTYAFRCSISCITCPSSSPTNTLD